MKTAEVAEIIRPGFAGLENEIELAFVFGSVATGYDDDEAEKNVVVIGDIGCDKLHKAILPLAEKKDAAVTIHCFTRQEYVDHFLSGKIFIRKTANAPKTWFIGEDRDLMLLYYNA